MRRLIPPLNWNPAPGFLLSFGFLLLVHSSIPVFAQEGEDRDSRQLLREAKSHQRNGRLNRAEKKYKSAIQVAEQRKNTAVLVRAHIALGDLLFEEKGSPDFAEHYRTAASRKGEMKNRKLKIEILIRQARLRDVRKKYKKARDFYWSALIRSDTALAPALAAKAMNGFIGSLASSGAARPQILSTLTRLEKICRTEGYPTAYAQLLLTRSSFMGQEMNRRSTENMKEIARKLKEAGTGILKTLAEDLLTISRTGNDSRRNLFLSRKATEYASRTENRILRGRSYLRRARILFKQGNRSSAVRETKYAWGLLNSHPDFSTQIRLHMMRGQVHVHQEEPDQALSLFRIGHRLAGVAGELEWMQKFEQEVSYLENQFEFGNRNLKKSFRRESRHAAIRKADGEEPISEHSLKQVTSILSGRALTTERKQRLRLRHFLYRLRHEGLMHSESDLQNGGDREIKPDDREILRSVLTEVAGSTEMPSFSEKLLSVWKNAKNSLRWSLATRNWFRLPKIYPPEEAVDVLLSENLSNPLLFYVLGRLVSTPGNNNWLSNTTSLLLKKAEQPEKFLPVLLARHQALDSVLTSFVQNQNEEGGSLDWFPDQDPGTYPFFRSLFTWKNTSPEKKFRSAIAGLAIGTNTLAMLLLETGTYRSEYLSSLLGYLAGRQHGTRSRKEPEITVQPGWIKTTRNRYLAGAAGAVPNSSPKTDEDLEGADNVFSWLRKEQKITEASEEGTPSIRIGNPDENADTIAAKMVRLFVRSRLGAEPSPKQIKEMFPPSKKHQFDRRDFLQIVQTATGQIRAAQGHPYKTNQYIWVKNTNSPVHRVAVRAEFGRDGTAGFRIRLKNLSLNDGADSSRDETDSGLIRSVTVRGPGEDEKERTLQKKKDFYKLTINRSGPLLVKLETADHVSADHVYFTIRANE